MCYNFANIQTSNSLGQSKGDDELFEKVLDKPYHVLILLLILFYNTIAILYHYQHFQLYALLCIVRFVFCQSRITALLN